MNKFDAAKDNILDIHRSVTVPRRNPRLSDGDDHLNYQLQHDVCVWHRGDFGESKLSFPSETRSTNSIVRLSKPRPRPAECRGCSHSVPAATQSMAVKLHIANVSSLRLLTWGAEAPADVVHKKAEKGRYRTHCSIAPSRLLKKSVAFADEA
ncbi:hypothetical protein RGR602_PB00337 (plasmid) [Rhizobium gallicum bv. gallicum R602sp]|uniref:Uncharacterized protein n=1 Tax=Rhizobium gallicum bv. gallicum R602sp TaxID=1041138 RepID=A0A0B4X748_9HYPH|nr:hypothetical protein RGR602_PB00337 [Rhizobium gallicum bv. gallicum R602sp]